MKIIGSVKEDLAIDKRISITPDTVKKFMDLDFSVLLEKKYGDHLGIDDKEYKNNGASLTNSSKEVFESMRARRESHRKEANDEGIKMIYEVVGHIKAEGSS